MCISFCCDFGFDSGHKTKFKLRENASCRSGEEVEDVGMTRCHTLKHSHIRPYTQPHTHTHTQEHTHTEARTLRERDLASLLRHIGKCKQANKVKAGFFALKKQKKKIQVSAVFINFRKLDWIGPKLLQSICMSHSRT